MLFMNVYEVCVFTMNCDIDYPVCLAKFLGSSTIAIMLSDFHQNLGLRSIYAFIHRGIFTCKARRSN